MRCAAGMRIGLPVSERHRVADLLIDEVAERRMLKLFHRFEHTSRYRPLVEALLVDDFFDVARTHRIHDGEIPAANGVFTARSLARMYAALVTPDEFDEPPLLSPAALATATTVPRSARGTESITAMGMVQLSYCAHSTRYTKMTANAKINVACPPVFFS